MSDQNGDKTSEQAEQVKGSGDSGMIKDSKPATVTRSYSKLLDVVLAPVAVVGSICSILVLGSGYMLIHAEDKRKLIAPFEESCSVVEQQLGLKFNDDRGLLELAVKRFPDNMCVLYNNGITELNAGMKSITNFFTQRKHLETAISYLEKAISIQDSYYGRVNLGKALARCGMFAEAKSHLEVALNYTNKDWTSANDKERAETANWLAYVAFVQRDKDALLKYSEEAIDKETAEEDIPNNHTYRGMALLWSGKKEEAKGEFMFSKSEFVTQIPSTNHKIWNKARHLIMDYHSLHVLGDKDAEATRDKLISDYLESKVVTREDVDRIVVNNPPDASITRTQIMN